MVQKSILTLLRRYRRQLERAGLHVTQLVLYGSRARGEARPDSDIDVCVVLPRAPADRFGENVRLNIIARAVSPLIEATLCSSKEWRTDRVSPLLHEIRKDGVVVQ